MDGYHTKEMRRQGSCHTIPAGRRWRRSGHLFIQSRSPESAILSFSKSCHSTKQLGWNVGSSSDDSHVYYFNIFLLSLEARKKEEEFYSRIEWDSTLPLPYKSPSRRGGDGRGIDPRRSGSCALYTELERALPVLVIYMWLKIDSIHKKKEISVVICLFFVYFRG